MSEASRLREAQRDKGGKATKQKSTSAYGRLHGQMASWRSKWRELGENNLPLYVTVLGLGSVLWFFFVAICEAWIQDNFGATWRGEIVTLLSQQQTWVHALVFSLLAGFLTTTFGVACHFSHNVRAFRNSPNGRHFMITLFVGLMGAALFMWMWRASKPHESALPDQGVQTAQSPSPETPTSTSPISKPPPTIHGLFKSDFSNCAKSSAVFTVEMQGGTTVAPIATEYSVCLDFETQSKFLLLYVPDSPMAFQVCGLLADRKDQFLKRASNVSIALKMLGQTNFDKSEELVFTGKTYIYYETPFTLEQLGQLDAYYRSKGMSPQFRGLDYMASVWLNEKLKSYPAPPTTQNP